MFLVSFFNFHKLTMTKTMNIYTKEKKIYNKKQGTVLLVIFILSKSRKELYDKLVMKLGAKLNVN